MLTFLTLHSLTLLTDHPGFAQEKNKLNRKFEMTCVNHVLKLC